MHELDKPASKECVLTGTGLPSTGRKLKQKQSQVEQRVRLELFMPPEKKQSANACTHGCTGPRARCNPTMTSLTLPVEQISCEISNPVTTGRQVNYYARRDDPPAASKFANGNRLIRECIQHLSTFLCETLSSQENCPNK
jgi:hypothetical protein